MPGKSDSMDTSGYIGVSPEYRNYADETHRPFITPSERAYFASVGIKTDDEVIYESTSAADVVDELVTEVDEADEADETDEVETTPKSSVKEDDKKTSGLPFSK